MPQVFVARFCFLFLAEKVLLKGVPTNCHTSGQLVGVLNVQLSVCYTVHLLHGVVVVVYGWRLGPFQVMVSVSGPCEWSLEMASVSGLGEWPLGVASGSGLWEWSVGIVGLWGWSLGMVSGNGLSQRSCHKRLLSPEAVRRSPWVSCHKRVSCHKWFLSQEAVLL